MKKTLTIAVAAIILMVGVFVVSVYAATSSYVYQCDSTHIAKVAINNTVTQYACDGSNQLVIIVSSPNVSPVQ